MIWDGNKSDGTGTGGGTAGVLGIIEGANVDVDSSNPQYPIVSATYPDIDLPSFWNSDTVTAAGSGDLDLVLTYVPDVDSLHIRLDGIDQAPTQWSYDSGTNTVTLDDPDDLIEAGWKMTAAYAHLEAWVPPAPDPLVALTMHGTPTQTAVTAATSLALPAGTDLGDFVVVAIDSMSTAATPGTATITDARFTPVLGGDYVNAFYCESIDDLGDVDISNPDGHRMHVTIASFDAPAGYKEHDKTGPVPGGAGTFTAPVVASTAAILVVTSRSPNGTGNTINSVPVGYTVAINPPGSAGVCNASIWYMVDAGATSSPSGSISYSTHWQGFVRATCIGLLDNGS